jgi:(S)-2-hydroxyglutarate dehydrogenase
VQSNYDIIIIGAGAVGLATAYHLISIYPKYKIAVLEKESDVAAHQTGNNSGVIHSGIYYKPGSLKAINCKKGYEVLLDFCNKYNVKHEICGKVVVATRNEEKKALENIFKRGLENGLNGIKKISSEEVKEIEPYVKSVEGVWVPQTGIINYKTVTKKFQDVFVFNGGKMHFGTKVNLITESSQEINIETTQGKFTTKYLVNCAGLYSDKIAKMTMPNVDVKIIPFRGEYYELVKSKEYLVKNLVYPVPNPDFPFLGVHYTRMVDGGIEAGPNAVLAFKREGYKKTDFDASELLETLSYSGFQKVAMKFWRDGLGEIYRSYSKAAFVKALKHLIPDIEMEDLVPGGAGVRAQAIDSKGNLCDDFLIFEKKNIVNICNAPSPAATASLAIGEFIANKLSSHF